MVQFAVPAKNSGTVGTVPTVPGATAVYYRHAARSFQIYSFAVEKLQHIIEWRLVIMP